MSNCITIQLQTIPMDFPAHLIASNGSVYFDLPGDFVLSKSKNEESVSRFNAVSGEGVLGFAIPATDRNRAILGCYTSIGGLVNDDDTTIPVIVIEQGYTLRQNIIRFVGRTDSSGEYEVELIDSNDFWKTALEDVTLDQLDFGTFELTEENLIDNWENATTYEDDDQGVVFPLIHYGNWFDPATYNDDGDLTAATTVSVEDFRPLFHVLSVLQKMFNKVGWNFRSPILETDIWRKRASYICIDFEGGVGLEGFKYRAEVQEDYLIQGGNGPEPEDDSSNIHALETFDNPGVYFVDFSDPEFDYYYTQGLCGKFTFTAVLDFEVPVNSVIQVIFFVTNSGAAVSSQTQDVYVLSPGGVSTVTSQPIELEASHRLTISALVISGTTPATHKIKAGSYIFNTPISVGVCEDMSMPLDSYVRDYPALDYLAGILHIIGGGRLVTDFATKTLWVYHPHRKPIPGETYITEAFYKTPNQAVNITPITNCDSLELTRNRIELARYYRLAFAGQDDYLESLGYSDDNPAFAHVEDFGSKYKNDYEDDNNPFFEGTGEIEALDIKPDGETSGVLIPAMWDDDDRTRKATDVAPRIINLGGYIEQHVTEAQKRFYSFKGDSTTELSFSYLETSAFINSDLDQPANSLAYGGMAIDNSYELYWKSELAAMLRDRSIGFLVMIDQCFFLRKDAFRYPYLLQYKGEVLLLQLKNIDDFIACESIMTPLQFALYPVLSEYFDQTQGVITNLWLLEDGSGYFELEDETGRYELE